ncbi:Retrovirus-related Pol polyprotein from transposon 17.6, partial [Mucuna pruriens]
MALENREKTKFITIWGTFYYKVMPFGLKNVGVTYQKAMVALFHDIMHKEIEVYVDDMITKSKTLEQQVEDLRKLFTRLRKYKLRLNPAKLNERGIEVDLDKVKVIREMPALRIESEEAFEKIKQYLENPPILVPIIPRKPLILYLTVLEESMGCVLGVTPSSAGQAELTRVNKRSLSRDEVILVSPTPSRQDQSRLGNPCLAAQQPSREAQ